MREMGNRTPKRKLINSYQESAALSQVVINSSQIVIEDSTEDTEESKGNIENVVPNLPSNSSNNNITTITKFM